MHRKLENTAGIRVVHADDYLPESSGDWTFLSIESRKTPSDGPFWP
jgi:hypothetical protein